MCDSEFTLPSHCERHMAAAYPGFGHLCSTCVFFFSSRDSKYGCNNLFKSWRGRLVHLPGKKQLSLKTSKNPGQNPASLLWSPLHQAIITYSISWPRERISPWMPGSMWRQAGRTHSSGKLSQGSPPQRINRTKTGWWDLANGRHNWPRRNNRHLQTKRCSQAKLKVKVNNGRCTQNWPLIFGCIAACRVYIVL